MKQPSVGVVVLAYGDEPLLPEVLGAVTASTGVQVDLIVVDNGYTGPAAAELRGKPLQWLTPGTNTGYTGGCNLGASWSASEYIAFLNSDAVVAPEALARLVDALADPTVGIATALVLLYDEPDVVNSAGNPVHYSMLSWAGGWGDPASEHQEPTEPASASGALMMMRAAVFAELEGFHEELFAYGEDVDLSLRAWQAGYRIRYEPRARVWHKYEFSRNPRKFYLLERNRWINLLTLYEGRTLLRLALGLAAVEAGIWASSVSGGWWREKVRATGWLVRNRRTIRRRRAWVQSRRRVSDDHMRDLLQRRIAPSPRAGQSVPAVVNLVIEILGRLGAAESS